VIITELVVNHTFRPAILVFQRARRAKVGSVYRDLYVCRTTDRKYAGTRVILFDTRAGRTGPLRGGLVPLLLASILFAQPDLNFDNPRGAERKDACRGVLQSEIIGSISVVMGCGSTRSRRTGGAGGLTNNEKLPETPWFAEADQSQISGCQYLFSNARVVEIQIRLMRITRCQ